MYGKPWRPWQCLVHIILNIGPILTKPAPIESSRPGLSIRTGFVEIGAMLRKLWGEMYKLA